MERALVVGQSSPAVMNRSNHGISFLSPGESEAMYRLLTQEVIVQPISQNPIDVEAAEAFPEVVFTPLELMIRLARKLNEEGITLQDIRLEGSGASHCLCETKSYNDLDIVFHLGDKSRDTLSGMRDHVQDVISSFLEDQYPSWKEWTSEHPISMPALPFIHKMFITPSHPNLKTKGASDAWALFTLDSLSMEPDRPPSIDLKFVQSVSRAYEFSIDSFQILLTLPIMLRLQRHFTEKDNDDSDDTDEEIEGTQKKLPPFKIVLECMFGDAEAARNHLKEKTIAVTDCSYLAGVYGGGLLKYANLIAQGYHCKEDIDSAKMERCMCTRFQIDFPGGREDARSGYPVVLKRLIDYLNTHLRGAPDAQVAFLCTLRTIAQRSGGYNKNPILQSVWFLLETTWLHMYYADSQYYTLTQPPSMNVPKPQTKKKKKNKRAASRKKSHSNPDLRVLNPKNGEFKEEFPSLGKTKSNQELTSPPSPTWDRIHTNENTCR